jgi:hypothetical protein
MIQDIIYDAPLFVFEAPTSGSAVAITAYSYDGDDYDFSSTGGETSVVFIN